MQYDEIITGITEWRPDATEFVIFTKEDWTVIRSQVEGEIRSADGSHIELLPLTLEKEPC
jgi:hypothetical protein